MPAAIRGIYSKYCVHFIRGFPRILVDPYHEPLVWLMIEIHVHVY